MGGTSCRSHEQLGPGVFREDHQATRTNKQNTARTTTQGSATARGLKASSHADLCNNQKTNRTTATDNPISNSQQHSQRPRNPVPKEKWEHVIAVASIRTQLGCGELSVVFEVVVVVQQSESQPPIVCGCCDVKQQGCCCYCCCCKETIQARCGQICIGSQNCNFLG